MYVSTLFTYIFLSFSLYDKNKNHYVCLNDKAMNKSKYQSFLPKDYPIFAIARFHVISGFESEYFSKRIPVVKDMPQYIKLSILNLITNYKY